MQIAEIEMEASATREYTGCVVSKDPQGIGYSAE
jgi:hypothetical protein